MKGIKTEIEFLKLIDLILEIKKEINDKLWFFDFELCIEIMKLSNKSFIIFLKIIVCCLNSIRI
jgi:hypothetical protein